MYIYGTENWISVSAALYRSHRIMYLYMYINHILLLSNQTNICGKRKDVHCIIYYFVKDVVCGMKRCTYVFAYTVIMILRLLINSLEILSFKCPPAQKMYYYLIEKQYVLYTLYYSNVFKKIHNVLTLNISYGFYFNMYTIFCKL